jgi:hypothetical protein
MVGRVPICVLERASEVLQSRRLEVKKKYEAKHARDAGALNPSSAIKEASQQKAQPRQVGLFVPPE